MSRFPQQQAIRGSQKWLQVLIENRSDLLNAHFRAAAKISYTLDIDWLSPVALDAYAEYRDDAFLHRLGVKLPIVPLNTFWPALGPQWDGLGKSNRGDLILIEAKAHLSEIISPATTATAEASIQLIQQSLNDTKKFLGSSSRADWSQTFYQYANRLAHLYLLRRLNGLPAYLVNIYFVNDADMDGPTSIAEWQGALKLLKIYLGVEHTPLDAYCIDLFFDVKDLK